MRGRTALWRRFNSLFASNDVTISNSGCGRALKSAAQNGTDMKISIAMATYNGAPFLQEQLDSFLEQTRLPDELVVCDDASTDSTLEVLHRFAHSAPFAVRYQRNERNLGSTRNFERAISLCRGEVIYLADQDDIWNRHKIERILGEFDDPEVDMVFSDADVVDATGRFLGYRLWDAVSFTRSRRNCWISGGALDTQLQRRAVTGATMAFRAEFRKVVSPIPSAWVHDAWISMLVSAMSNTTFVSEPLINYRQHCRNQIGARRRTSFERIKDFSRVTPQRHRLRRLLRQIRSYRVLQERLNKCGVTTNVQEPLQTMIQHLCRRVEAIETRSGASRAKIVLAELAAGRYARYSQSTLTAFRDLLGK